MYIGERHFVALKRFLVPVPLPEVNLNQIAVLIELVGRMHVGGNTISLGRHDEGGIHKSVDYSVLLIGADGLAQDMGFLSQIRIPHISIRPRKELERQKSVEFGIRTEQIG